jgi:hypothetical protein
MNMILNITKYALSVVNRSVAANASVSYRGVRGRGRAHKAETYRDIV